MSIDFLNKLFKNNPDVVIVGSWVLKINHLINKTPNDIDVVITSKDSLKELGKIKYFNSNSPIANGCLRGKMVVENVQVDIWVVPELPDYDVIGEVKFINLDLYFKWYEDLLNRTNSELFVTLAKEKLDYKKALTNNICYEMYSNKFNGR